MMRTLFLFAAILAFGISGPPSTVLADECEFANPDEAKAMAKRAAAYLDAEGPKTAFPTFMTPGSDYYDRDLYVFVLDLKGVLYASGAFPNSIGAVAYDAQDKDGRYFIREMIALAQNEGEGWIEYDLMHPCTGEMTPKISYVIKVGPFVVGVGAFGTIAT